jgi:Tetracyclin repressor-like, C-terminal domain
LRRRRDRGRALWAGGNVGPATRVTLALAAVVSDAAAAGTLHNPFTPRHAPALSKRAAAEASQAGSIALPGVPVDAVVRALTAWTQLFGYLSFELFGHLDGVIEDRDALFDQSVTDMGAYVGIPSPPSRRQGARSTKTTH